MSASKDQTYYRLNYKVLQIGDVLIESGESKFGDVIRFVERRPFTHALICIDGGQVVEAVTRGVVFLSATRIVTREFVRYRQLRYLGLTDAQKGVIEAAVRSQAFKNYNLRGALGTKAEPIRTRRNGDKFFCSELVTAAYKSAGIVLVPGSKEAAVTPNMLLGGKSLLADVTSPDLFEMIPVLGDDDRRAVEAMLDRDKNIQGTEVDENRHTEQDVVKIYKKEIEVAHRYLDGEKRRVNNLAEMLFALSEMKVEDAVVLSDQLNNSLKASGYFEIFNRAVAKSHISTWMTDVAQLWFAGRRTEAMEFIDSAHEMAVLYRETAQRMRTDADAISPELTSRLSVFKSYKEILTQNVATLEAHCSKVDKLKKIRDLTFPTRGG